MTAAVESRLLDALAQYDDALRQFKHRYRARLAHDMVPSMRTFADYLSTVQTSEWLSFARGLFNESVKTSGVEHLLFHGTAAAGDPQRFQTPPGLPAAVSTAAAAANGFNLSGVAADFASFVDIQEVEEIQQWSRQFWERYAI